MPDSWVVLYNLNSSASIGWAYWYAYQWGVPESNLLGLSASTSEHLATLADAQAQIFNPVRAFLAAHPDIAANTMGFIVGYGVPGHYGDATFGVGGLSIASGLHDLTNTTMGTNYDSPHYTGRVLPSFGRLTRARMRAEAYMAARIDAPSGAVAAAMTLRAVALKVPTPVMPGQYVWYDYSDAVLPNGTWQWLKTAVESSTLSWVPWQSFDADTQSCTLDAFRFDTHDVDGWDDFRLRGEPVGPRILAYDLNSWGATTVRSTTAEGGRFVPNAIDAGYAAAIGATGEPSTVVGPFPDTILAGLHEGWTIGECFYLANPYEDFVWELVGDPLLTVPDWVPVPKPPAPGDFDHDGDVDLADFTQFLACYNGPLRPPIAEACLPSDVDDDGDVDVTDFALFLSCFNGPDRPPACSR